MPNLDIINSLPEVRDIHSQFLAASTVEMRMPEGIWLCETTAAMRFVCPGPSCYASECRSCDTSRCTGAQLAGNDTLKTLPELLSGVCTIL